MVKLSQQRIKEIDYQTLLWIYGQTKPTQNKEIDYVVPLFKNTEGILGTVLCKTGDTPQCLKALAVLTKYQGSVPSTQYLCQFTTTGSFGSRGSLFELPWVPSYTHRTHKLMQAHTWAYI